MALTLFVDRYELGYYRAPEPVVAIDLPPGPHGSVAVRDERYRWYVRDDTVLREELSPTGGTKFIEDVPDWLPAVIEAIGIG